MFDEPARLKQSRSLPALSPIDILGEPEPVLSNAEPRFLVHGADRPRGHLPGVLSLLTVPASIIHAKTVANQVGWQPAGSW
jgi:hypothetical protein